MALYSMHMTTCSKALVAMEIWRSQVLAVVVHSILYDG